MPELCEAARALKIVEFMVTQAIGSGVINLPALKQATNLEPCNCNGAEQ